MWRWGFYLKIKRLAFFESCSHNAIALPRLLKLFVAAPFNLSRRFSSLNRRFFGGKLPRDTIVVWMRNRDLMGACILAPATVSVHQGLRNWPKAAEMTLLHEMCHLALGNYGHGPTFQREMRRLALAGAFDRIW